MRQGARHAFQPGFGRDDMYTLRRTGMRRHAAYIDDGPAW